MRDILLAAQFGITGSGIYNLDTYFAAFRVPDLIYTLIVFGGLSAAFVPLITPLSAQEKKVFTSSVLLAVVGLTFLLCGIAFCFAHPLAALIAPGFDIAAQEQTALLLRIQLIAPLAFAISGVLSGIAQSTHRFFWYALAPLCYNLGIIGGTVFLGTTYGVYGVSLGVALGALLHAAIQLPLLVGHIGMPRHLLRHARNLFTLALPRIGALFVGQLQFALLSAIASFTAGLASAFWFAWNIASLPLGVIGLAVATASFSTLAKTAEDTTQFRATLSRAISSILYLTVPAAIGIALLAHDTVRIILHYGVFTDASLALVTQQLLPLTCAIPLLALMPLLQNAFFARKKALPPLYAACAGLMTAWLCSSISMSPALIALSAIFVATACLVVPLWADIRAVQLRITLIASSIMGIALYYPAQADLPTLIRLPLIALLGCGIYFGIHALCQQNTVKV